MKNWYKKVWVGCIIGCLTIACSDSNDGVITPPTQEGGQVSLERFENIKVYPGNRRIKVEYKYSDSRAKLCEVYWKGEDGKKKYASAEMTVSEGDQFNEIYIDNIDEGSLSLNFMAYTEDRTMNSPKWIVAPVNVYGEKYAAEIKAPEIANMEWNTTDYALSFNWSADDKNVLQYLLKYTDVNGEFQEVKAEPGKDNTVTLPNFPENGELEVITVYHPNGGIDDIQSTPTKIKVGNVTEIPWELKATMQAAPNLVGWQAVDSYMKKFNFEYTEHPDNGGGKDHESDTHIEVLEDKGLGQWVFKFNVHASGDADGNILVLDGDRGSVNDRMRNEMKSRTGDDRYYMNGNWEEWQRIEWKFKIPKGFRPTKSFTHIHQLKAQEGNNGSPLITITPRASDANGKNSRIQVIHTGDNSSTNKGYIVDNLPLSDFEDEWIQVTSEIYYTHHGTYYIKMERISDGKVLVEKTIEDIDMWRKGATNIRNKFGIYRSYGGKLESDFKGKFPNTGIKDESLYLADFKIYEKNTNPNPQPHD